MAVSVNDINKLKDKTWYETSNEKIVLTKDYERIIHSPEFSILGFLNGYMYYTDTVYMGKATLEGNSIAEIKLDISNGSFMEGYEYFIGWYEKTIYKINDNIEVEWTLEFDDYIRDIVMDIRGDFYIIFENDRSVMKYTGKGEPIVYLEGTDDPAKEVSIYAIFVSKGAGWVYLLGTEFWGIDGKCQSFVDKYNCRTWEKVDRVIIESDRFVKMYDPRYKYKSLYIRDDYMYIIGEQFISRYNIKGIELWKNTLGYNAATGTMDTIGTIAFDDNPYTEFIYFVEDLYSSNGHGFGKMSITGKTLWKITLTDSIEKVDFKLTIYRDKMYVSDRTLVQQYRNYVLALDDNKVLFRTRQGRLVNVVMYNSEEIYSSDNYYGYYLIADKIKEEIPWIVYHPLLHDNGEVVDEELDVILLPEENEGYTNEDNYDYYYLLASSYGMEDNSLSILFLKNYKPILTKLGNVLKTKEPYLPDRIHEFILNMPGNRIDTMQDFDLVRSRFTYSYDRYLLADRNMFFTDIVTKNLEYVIITKDKGFDIVRKSREIYNYLLSRYDDMSLIEEWLKENGVTESPLPEYVDELRHHTMGMIQDIQIAGVPTVYDVQPLKRHEYTFDGYEYLNNTWGSQIFTCTNMPFDKRKCFKKAYIDSIANLVKRQEMRPVLFFINGKAIPWSDCTIVRDWAYTYVIVNNTNPYEKDLSCIIFPCDIRYGEDNNCLSEEVCKTHLYFDSEGKYTTNIEEVAIRIEVIDKNVVGGIFENPSFFEVENLYRQKASDRNILVFEDRMLFPDARFYMNEHGKDIFTYDHSENKDKVFNTFYWIKGNDYYGTLYKIPNGENTKEACKEIAQDISRPEVQNFNVPFNFKMWRNKTWEENVAQAVEYIMQYDMSLLVQYYKQISNIESYVFTGEYLRDRVPKDGGWLVMPRHRKRKHDDYIIVFRNNHLYEYYKEIEYDAHNFKIPIFGHIARTDRMEIVHFKEVDNSYYSLTITDDKVSDYIPEGLRYDNFLLFGNSPSHKQFYDTFSVENSIQYEINFEYRNNFSESGEYMGTDFKLNDPYYLNKSINICSKHQFQYMYYNIFYNRKSVNLSPDFRFCHDKTKFMIFKNGLIIPRDTYDLHVMTNETPAKYISITFEEELLEGERIDIFYLPMSYDEIDITSDIDYSQYNMNRDINISMDHLGYQFDKDLYWVSVSGKKINYQIIQNIDNHRCRVTEDPHLDDLSPRSVDRWFIYRFMQPDKLLSKLYSYSDKWTDAVDALTPIQYKSLLNDHIKK